MENALPRSPLAFTHMTKLLLLITCFAVLASGSAGAITDSPRPNVLFIFTDDQRADTLSALGNAHLQTPNLDRLVKRGLAFNRAYMQGGMQPATCVPSRAMLLSGRSLFHIDEKLTRDETWPAAFGRSGYTTFISGKWHNGPHSVPLSFQRAQSLFTGGMTDPLKAPLTSLKNGRLTPATISKKHACEVFAEETIAFLKEPHATPFLAYLAFDGPHDPHIVPEDYPVKYDPAKLPLPPNFLPIHPFDNGEMTIRDEKLLPKPRSSDEVRAMLADYYRYISYLDLLIGRVLDTLDASPAANNTIVVFSADSGVARGSHGLIGKQNLYEHSLRVPLIIAGPGIPADQKTDAMCYLFDVMPTLGAICGVRPPRTSEGRDLTTLLRNPHLPGRSTLFFAYRDVQRAIRDERYKLLHYPRINRTQLFDLTADPHELHDLSAEAQHTEKRRQLEGILAEQIATPSNSSPSEAPDSNKPADSSTPAQKADK